MEQTKAADENAYDGYIEQLIQQNQQLLNEQAALKAQIAEYPSVYIPDYDKELRQIYGQLNHISRAYQSENISALFTQMDQRIAAMPKVIPVKHHHHLDGKFKWLMIIYFTLIISVAVLTGTTIGFATRSYLLKQQVLADKQKIDMGNTADKTLPVKNTPKKKPLAHKSRSKRTRLSTDNL